MNIRGGNQVLHLYSSRWIVKKGHSHVINWFTLQLFKSIKIESKYKGIVFTRGQNVKLSLLSQGSQPIKAPVWVFRASQGSKSGSEITMKFLMVLGIKLWEQLHEMIVNCAALRLMNGKRQA